MKIRHGFISNSSSSSFVVAFPKVPTSINDVKEMLFGTDIWYDHPYADIYKCDGYSVEQVAETVFNDIQQQQPNSTLRIQEAFDELRLEELDPIAARRDSKYNWQNSPRGTGAELDAWYQAYEKRKKHFLDKKILSFLKEHKDKFIYTFEYGDENGEYCSALEHGDLFKKLPHETISRH